MFIYNGADSAVNLDLAARLLVTGGGSTWGITAQLLGGSEPVAPTGTYATEGAAQAALVEILNRVGWTALP